jgi:hypothetical protein
MNAASIQDIVGDLSRNERVHQDQAMAGSRFLLRMPKKGEDKVAEEAGASMDMTRSNKKLVLNVFSDALLLYDTSVIYRMMTHATNKQLGSCMSSFLSLDVPITIHGMMQNANHGTVW